MSLITMHEYPELRQLFGAYFNADAFEEYASVDEAMDAYIRETGVGHRVGALMELDRLAGDDDPRSPVIALGCDLAFRTAAEGTSFLQRVRQKLVSD